MNYIDMIARMVYQLSSSPDSIMEQHEWPLYRIYAVLALAKGEETTAVDVHNAWAAWATEHRAFSKNIIPFHDLHPEIRAMDDEYVEAIHAISRLILSERAA